MKALFKCAFIFLFFQTNIILKAQGISNRWLMGYASGFSGFGGININFDSLPIVATYQNRKMNFDRTNASICNRQGRLLFYTNGIFIANANNDTMFNGSHLSPGAFTNYYKNDGEPVIQMALILPDPSDTNLFFLFHEAEDYSNGNWSMPNKLLYSKVDMRLDNNKGAVIQKNSIVFQDTLLSGELTACRHGNGRDWWLLCHQSSSDLFYKFIITPQGILGPFQQHFGNTLSFGGCQSAFSPDGKKYAFYHGSYGIDIHDFDRCNGNLSNWVHIPLNDSTVSTGIAFSANSQFLYIISTNYVYQYNLLDTNLVTSFKKIATWDGFYSPHPPLATNFNHAQLAPDGKIYINSGNSVDYLHVINSPDSIGLACSLVQHSFFMPALNFRTIPNHPNYFLGADSGSVCDTLQLGTINTELRIQNERISVYPNPAHFFFRINYTPTAEVKTLRIFDVDGKIVLERKLSPFTQLNQIDVGKFIEGIYLCRISYRDRLSSCKFIVVH